MPPADPARVDLRPDQRLRRKDIEARRKDLNKVAFEHCAPLQEIVPCDSETAFRKVRLWLDYCKRQHPYCRTKLSGTKYGSVGPSDCSRLPSRVVYLGESPQDQPHLVEPSESLEAEYAALSYCWGANPGTIGVGADGWPHVTLSTNLARRLGGFSPAEMPKTIRDSFSIAQRLAIKYIWIDCLCILQDDADDWEREAKKMGEIFESACVTIVALAADGIHDGCFFPRRQLQQQLSRRYSAPNEWSDALLDESQVTLPFLWRGKCLGYAHISLPWEEEDSSSETERPRRSRWAQRAWTYQEHHLSRRCIYYGKQQILWECQQEEWAEDNRTCNWEQLQDWVPAGDVKRDLARTVSLVNDPIASINDSFKDIVSIRPFGWLDHVPVYRNFVTWGTKKLVPKFTGKLAATESMWPEIVFEYSGRRLTNHKDKLVAIQGVANAMGRFKDIWTYCWGIFLQDVARGLFWKAVLKPLENVPSARGELYQIWLVSPTSFTDLWFCEQHRRGVGPPGTVQ